METVWMYLMNQWGAAYSGRYIDTLTETFGFLANNPKAGTRCDNIRRGYRRYPVIRHVVYYRVTDYGIEIVRVLHDRMLAQRHF